MHSTKQRSYQVLNFRPAEKLHHNFATHSALQSGEASSTAIHQWPFQSVIEPRHVAFNCLKEKLAFLETELL